MTVTLTPGGLGHQARLRSAPGGNTFVTFTRRSSPRTDIIESFTHNAKGAMIDRYNRFQWAPRCDVMRALDYDENYDERRAGSRIYGSRAWTRTAAGFPETSGNDRKQGKRAERSAAEFMPNGERRGGLCRATKGCGLGGRAASRSAVEHSIARVGGPDGFRGGNIGHQSRVTATDRLSDSTRSKGRRPWATGERLPWRSCCT